MYNLFMKNVVYKVITKTKKRKIVYESESLDDCFRFVLSLKKEMELKSKSKEEEKYQRFLDFGEL